MVLVAFAEVWVWTQAGNSCVFLGICCLLAPHHVPYLLDLQFCALGACLRRMRLRSSQESRQANSPHLMPFGSTV